jgi:hypothetical protein
MAIVAEYKEFEVEEHLKKLLIELAFVVHVVPIVGTRGIERWMNSMIEQ